jgi:hypothetical protein
MIGSLLQVEAKDGMWVLTAPRLDVPDARFLNDTGLGCDRLTPKRPSWNWIVISTALGLPGVLTRKLGQLTEGLSPATQ